MMNGDDVSQSGGGLSGFDLGGFDLGGPAVPGGASSEVFERNMVVLARTSPHAAAQIRAASPTSSTEWVESDEADPGLVLHEGAGESDPLGMLELMGGGPGSSRVLASRRRPITEGVKLAEGVDLEGVASVCVYGFGAGYHCRALGERLGRMGAVVCFEPDVGLLRSVFERVDHSAWMLGTNFVIVTEADHPSAVTAAIGGIEAILSLGVRVVEHPASRARLKPTAARFGESFTKAMRSMRTSVMTTLVRAQASLQNVLMNADHYARSEGIGALRDVAKGRPAVVVSAGPSLERNLHLLAEPGVRDRAVIIAAQTMLKPMLRKGIRPHFVCALDYHELSKRFYEGLTASDVEGVTLVVEPKANPAILDAFPGVIRCVQDAMLDETLGSDLAGEKASIRPGATVAHLCSYLGRHLGCDPLVFIGQDLGFTDGQYYSAGAAIHDVWAGELGPVRTLEMFEWERIVRSKNMLRKAEDVLGRSIYTDEQMATYLSQFEVDFAADTAKGLSVIDATEGGVRKRHAEVKSLADALAACASAEPLPGVLTAPDARMPDRSPEVAARLEEIAKQAVRVESLSRKAAGILGKMIASGATPAKIDRLVTDVYKVRDEVRVIEPAYSLVQHMNQTGALRRFKADREIEMAHLEEREKQRRQIERDIANVEWTADAAAELADQLRDSAAAIRGERAKATTDPTPNEVQQMVEEVRVGAVLFIDPEINGLGLARHDDAVAAALGASAIRLTVQRLLRAGSLDTVVIATGDVDWVAGRLGDLAGSDRVRIERVDADLLRSRTRAVGRARLMSPDAWRGSLGGLSCYDESLDPGLCAGLLENVGLDAGLIVGADWVLVDPGFVDAVVTRYRERPDVVRLSLTQAAPGLAGILFDRRSMGDLAGALGHAMNYASIGGALSYLPVSPQADPIAKAFCVSVPHAVRDAGFRLIPDTPDGIALVAEVLDRLGDSWIEAGAETVVSEARSVADSRSGIGSVRRSSPRHLQLELCTGRLAGGLFAGWLRGGGDGERPVLETGDAVRIVEAFSADRPDTVLTLHGLGDPLMHPGVFDVISAARAAGVGLVHLRTDALSEAFDVDRLVASGLDVLSVDVLAATPEVYRVIAGVDRYEAVKTRVEDVLAARGESAGLPGMWVVPRITRCDEAYEDIEGFYDGWLMACCSAVIDPVVTAEGGAVALDASARIRGLPLPGLARERIGRDTVVVRSDGSLAADSNAAGLEPVLQGIRAKRASVAA